MKIDRWLKYVASPSMLRFWYVLMAALMALAFGVSLWRGAPVFKTLGEWLPLAYVYGTAIIGFVLARGNVEAATEFALQAIPVPMVFILILTANFGTWSVLASLVTGLPMVLSMVMAWAIGIREMRKELAKHKEQSSK
jgi:uncharacterized membrane protein